MQHSNQPLNQPPNQPLTHHHLIDAKGQMQLSNVPTQTALEMLEEGRTSSPQEILYKVPADEPPLTLFMVLLEEIYDGLRGGNNLTITETRARAIYIGGLQGRSPAEMESIIRAILRDASLTTHGCGCGLTDPDPHSHLLPPP